VYGVSLEDIIDLTERQINVSCEDIISKAKGFKKIKVIKGVMKEECLELYK